MTSRFLLAGLLAATACAPADSAEHADHPVPVAVPAVRLTPGRGADYYRAAGSVRAAEHADLSTRITGRVVAVMVRSGDPVHSGEILVTLDRSALDAARRQAAAGLELATSNLQRMERLLADSAVPLAQVEAARNGYQQAQGQVAAVEADLDYTSIRAPFDGIITARMADPGDLAAPGRPLLTLEGQGAREILAGVPDDLARRLRVGMTVSMTVGAGDRHAGGRVLAIVPGPESGSRTMEVRLAGPADLPSGIAAVVEFPMGEHSALFLPRSALIERGQLTGTFLFTADTTLHLRWLRTGRSTDDSVEVLSGLLAGDLVALEAGRVHDGLLATPVLPPRGDQ
jgi:RND family efflux transporter MFP subunit